MTYANRVIIVEQLADKKVVSIQSRNGETCPWRLDKMFNSYKVEEIPILIKELRKLYNVSPDNVFISANNEWTPYYGK